MKYTEEDIFDQNKPPLLRDCALQCHNALQRLEASFLNNADLDTSRGGSAEFTDVMRVFGALYLYLTGNFGALSKGIHSITIGALRVLLGGKTTGTLQDTTVHGQHQGLEMLPSCPVCSARDFYLLLSFMRLFQLSCSIMQIISVGQPHISEEVERICCSMVR